jgi:hypothetical protein
MSVDQDCARSDLQVNINKKALGSFGSDIQPMHQIPSRFNLPADAVHSVSPTSGASAPGTVLPHIAFKGADVPWSRSPTNALYENEGQVKNG